jgi:uncharacterized membrane protein
MPTLSGSRPPAARVLVLDFIRLAALLLMVQGHTVAALVAPAHLDLASLPGWAWSSVRGLTMPMFMMVSGAVSALGVRHDPDGRLSRTMLARRLRMGCLVIAIGYLLVFPANRIADLRWVSPDSWRAFLAVNILQANGVTLLLLTGVLALAGNVRRYAAFSLVLGLAILGAAPLAAQVDWFRWLPESLAAYLSYEHGSLFPLLPTSAYMCLGVGLGALLLETPAERRARVFRMGCLAAGAGFLLVSLVAACLPWSLLPADEAWRGGYAYTTCRLGYTLVVFGLLGWIAERRPALAAAAAPLGRRSLFIYVAHLALVFGTPWTPGLVDTPLHDLSVAEVVPVVALVVAVCFGALVLWDRLKASSGRIGTLITVTAVLALVRVLVWGYRPPWLV